MFFDKMSDLAKDISLSEEKEKELYEECQKNMECELREERENDIL